MKKDGWHGWLAGWLAHTCKRTRAYGEGSRTEVEAGPLEADQLRERAPDQGA